MGIVVFGMKMDFYSVVKEIMKGIFVIVEIFLVRVGWFWVVC